MLLPRFDFHRPSGLGEALSMLGEYGSEAKVLAGGTDLLVNMKHGAISPKRVIAVEGLEELRMRQTSGAGLEVGACLKAAELAADSGLPLALRQGAAALGSPQVRNRATIGGNVVTARPAADMCVPLLALGAVAVLRGPKGERRLDLDEVFLGPGQTAIAPDEILVSLALPARAGGMGSGYEKLGLRRALEISLVNVAAWLELEADGKTIKDARVCLGAVAPRPILAPGAAQALVGAQAGQAAFDQAARAAAMDARPIDDHRGSAEYRRDMVAVLTRRALGQAHRRAQGGREAA